MTRSRLAALIGCLTLGPLVFPGASQAATITVDFTATATTGSSSGSLVGDSFYGSFSYSNTGLTGVGVESADATAFSFNFFRTYSLSDTSNVPIVFDNGELNSLAFLADGGNDIASGMPDLYITLNQSIPEFLYGYDVAGENFPSPDGSCPDALNSCYSWQGSGNVTFSPGVVTPEPAGPVPVLGYLLVLAGLLWWRRRRPAR